MQLTFTLLPDPCAITHLPADAPIPDWADGDGLVTITRALDELSIVCPTGRAPDTANTGWSALRVDTLAALDDPGVVMAAVTPISSAGYGVFVISSHLRDHLLVRTTELGRIAALLSKAGHILTPTR